MRRVVHFAVGAAMAAITLIGAGALARPATAANASVSIAGFAFSPASVTVSAGDTVTWTNNDAGVPHTVSSGTGGELASGQLAGGASYQKTFTTPGTFAYHCDIHPSMTGVVIVTAAPAETATPAATPTATPTPAPVSTATATTPAAATASPTLAATPPATPTAAATASPASGTTPGPTPTAAPSPTGAPRPPATGDGGDGDNDTATVVTSGIVAIAIVLAVGAAVYAFRRRSAARQG